MAPLVPSKRLPGLKAPATHVALVRSPAARRRGRRRGPDKRKPPDRGPPVAGFVSPNAKSPNLRCKMARILYSNPIPATAAAPPPQPLAVDSDIVVILAALLCALICVVGLALVARCAWLRRSNSSPPSSLPPPPPSKGLKKKALRALPKEAFRPSCHAAKLADCPICLAEFADGDEIRILPQCGHGFHAGCVDTWLGSHSSCPSCRTVLVVEEAPPRAARCQKCGACCVAAEGEAGAKAREDRGDANSFLP